MTHQEIIDRLFELRDLKYREFSARLIPNISPESIIGVRTPDLRALANELLRGTGVNAKPLRARGEEDPEVRTFLKTLPHKYYEENQLHAFILSGIKNYDECIRKLNAFLPYVDNWATCDQMSPVVFKKNKDKLIESVRMWLKSDKTYTVRFGVKMLMTLYLDDDFKIEYPNLAACIKSDEYYVNMMLSWYFATALAKQYDAVIPFLEKRKLDKWVHNKTIQKACESYRITDERKAYLRSLK